MEDKFEYFIEETNKRFDKVDKKLDQLITFRLILIGGAATVSAVVTLVINLLMIWSRH